MIEFVSEIGDRQVFHTAYRAGRLLWEGSDPMTLLETDEFALWPQGEVVQLCGYLQQHSDLSLTARWRLSQATGVSGVAFVDGNRHELYGTIFSLFESSPLELVLKT